MKCMSPFDVDVAGGSGREGTTGRRVGERGRQWVLRIRGRGDGGVVEGRGVRGFVSERGEGRC